ncbi:DNA-binding protein [Stenotrophomonas sp. 169]|nr:DNA-binding protein [Stenotrophomonas sp. 169]
MARGITESEVHSAADAIVAGGERPTVERIRAYLGTGSPNTVVRWLETWWVRLAERLGDHQARTDVPDAPDTIRVLAGQWWALALEHGRQDAHGALVAERAVLAADRDRFALEKAQQRVEVDLLRQQAEEASQREGIASSQASELRRLLAQLEVRVANAEREMADAHGRLRTAEEVRSEAQLPLIKSSVTARSES